MDPITLLTQDHREVMDNIDRILGKKVDIQQQRLLLNQIIRDISQHTVAEEQELYPVLKHRVKEGGTELHREALEEHTRIKKLLKKLDKFSSRVNNLEVNQWPQFPYKRLERLRTVVQTHVQREENVILPKMQSVIPREEFNQLGRKLASAKSSAPTRPHPLAPDQPPFSSVVQPVVGAVDRMKDKSRDFPVGPSHT